MEENNSERTNAIIHKDYSLNRLNLSFIKRISK